MEKQEENQQGQTFAMEILADIKETSKFWVRFACAAFMGLTVLLALSILLNYKINRDWQKLFASYDYVTQDGTGINNFNSGTQGDLSNIPESVE